MKAPTSPWKRTALLLACTAVLAACGGGTLPEI